MQNSTSHYLTVYSPQAIQDLLSRGLLFHFDSKQSAVRAYLQANAHDPALHSLLHSKPPASALFQKYRSVLHQMNATLEKPIYTTNLPTCTTLLEQLQQEEQLIQAYVKQTVNDKRLYQRELPHSKIPAVLENLASQTPQDFALSSFLLDFPQYTNAASHEYAKVLCSGDRAKIQEYEHRDAIKKHFGISLLFKCVAVLLFAAICWKVSMHFSHKDLMLRIIIIVYIMLGVSPLLYITYHFGMFWVVKDLLIAPKELSPSLEVFQQRVHAWDNVFNPTTFEEKWFLRAYFSLMHSQSVFNTKELDARPRINYTHLSVKTFSQLIFHTYHSTFHADQIDNPLFDHTH